MGLDDLLGVDADLHLHRVGRRLETCHGLAGCAAGRLQLLGHVRQRAVHGLRVESALLDPIERFHAEAEAEQWTGYLADPFESAGELLTEPLGGNLPAVGSGAAHGGGDVLAEALGAGLDIDVGGCQLNGHG